MSIEEYKKNLYILGKYIYENRKNIIKYCKNCSKERGLSEYLVHIDDFLKSITFSSNEKDLIKE